MALTNKLEAIGDAIRGKTGKDEKLTLDQMVTEINGITTGGGGEELPEEAFVITNSCAYRFSNNGWNWFIEKYGNRITTKDVTAMNYMFYDSTQITKIPFDINPKPENSNINVSFMFSGCSKLEELPKMNNFKPSQTNDIFASCSFLRVVPEDTFSTWDWGYMDSLTSASLGSRTKQFYNCNSLRSFPMSFLERVNVNGSNSNSIYNNGFYNCYSLDEIVGLPCKYTSTWTTNAFNGTFSYCSRLKNITFALQENETPYAVKWKSQVIDLTNYVGFSSSYEGATTVCAYNSGITTDKFVNDDDKYQALKDDPDWYSSKEDYSRYNHDSAVATINSLPDTSAYLSSAGGTNTIKFRGNSGSKTDGGAINTLTEEEIAVATAKGWTVTLS